MEDKERTLNSPMEKIMVSLTGYASEMERDKARQRTYDAMVKKAKAGQVTGGKVYGYDNVDVFSDYATAQDDPKRLHVIRRINKHQAEVIKRVFELYAQRQGLTRIAKLLNAEGVPPPRTVKGWAPSCLREMLHRPLYRGIIVWNEYQKIYKGGTTNRRRRPQEEWIRLDAPDLRIIPPDLEKAVDLLLERNKKNYVRDSQSGQLMGRCGFRDFESNHLLAGFASCTVCGGPMTVQSYPVKGKRTKRYGCGYYNKRGTAICTNSLTIPMEALDQVVLKALSDVLDDRLLEQAIDTALNKIRAGSDHRLDRETVIKRELDLIDAKQEKIMDGIERGEPGAPLGTRLRATEARKTELIQELANLDMQSKKVATLDEARIKRQLRERASDVKGLLEQNTPQARQMLRKLLEGKLKCTPVKEEGLKGYQISGEGSYHRLLPTSLVLPTKVASPTGFEPVLPA